MVPQMYVCSVESVGISRPLLRGGRYSWYQFPSGELGIPRGGMYQEGRYIFGGGVWWQKNLGGGKQNIFTRDARLRHQSEILDSLIFFSFRFLLIRNLQLTWLEQ